MKKTLKDLAALS